MKAPRPLILEGDLPGSAAGSVYADAAQHLLKTSEKGGVVLVTSPARGQGRSTTAANLSLALLKQKASVLLLELTDSAPVLGTTFGDSPTSLSVENVLQGRGDLDAVICRRADTGLHLAMMRRSLPLELDTPTRRKALESMLAYARQRCTWVVIDGPSGQDAASVEQLAEQACATVIVANQRATRRSALDAQLQKLQRYKPLVLLTVS